MRTRTSVDEDPILVTHEAAQIADSGGSAWTVVRVTRTAESVPRIERYDLDAKLLIECQDRELAEEIARFCDKVAGGDVNMLVENIQMVFHRAGQTYDPSSAFQALAKAGLKWSVPQEKGR